MKKRKPEKQRNISQLKKLADIVFSKWIRQRDSHCITCGRPATQAGHYISRSWLGLRYHPKNVHGQDVRCNIFLKGNMDEYALFLKWKYGPKILEELNKLKKPTQFKRKDYLEIIRKYKI